MIDEREAKVLILRFGLFGSQPHTLKQIGSELKVTAERIRQIEAKALRKLKHPSRASLPITKALIEKGVEYLQPKQQEEKQ